MYPYPPGCPACDRIYLDALRLYGVTGATRPVYRMAFVERLPEQQERWQCSACDSVVTVRLVTVCDVVAVHPELPDEDPNWPEPSRKSKPRETRKGFVYFIGHATTGAVKVGFSDDPERRLGELQTGSPIELSVLGFVPGSDRYEAELHRRLDRSHLHGEWFEREAALQLLDHLRSTA